MDFAVNLLPDWVCGVHHGEQLAFRGRSGPWSSPWLSTEYARPVGRQRRKVEHQPVEQLAQFQVRIAESGWRIPGAYAEITVDRQELGNHVY